jgi:Clp amino terminal domain, pathogenicity island component
MWDRLSADGHEVITQAYAEASELGHRCLADEHVLLGVLRHGTSAAAALLEHHGLDLAGTRGELLRIGPSLDPRRDPAAALRTLGVDVDEVRERLEATFGTSTVDAAEWRVRRRPRWRGGHPRPSALCAYLLAKRSLEFAEQFAVRCGVSALGPEHLLYGVFRDARDPLGTQLSRRSRCELAVLGWTPGEPNPVRLLLEARGIELDRLTNELASTGTG